MNMSRNAGYINAYGGSQMGFIGKMTRLENTENVEVLQRDENGNLVINAETGVYETASVPKNPGEYSQSIATFTTTTTTTTTTTEQNYERYAFDGTVGGHTYMNLKHDIHRSPVSIFGLNALYAGGFEGVVVGNTHMYAGGGLHYDVFGGACNADIYGYAETIVGQDRDGNFSHNLQLRHCVYGGNDFGGQILGTTTHTVLNPESTGDDDKTKNVTSNTYVKYLGGTVERSIFGGSCGLYRYTRSYELSEADFVGEGDDMRFKYDNFMIADRPVTDAEKAQYVAAYKAYLANPTTEKPSIRLYPQNSWTSMPTLFTNLKGEYNETTKTYANPNAYNAVVDVACAEEFQRPSDTSLLRPNQILSNIFGGGYGFCDETGRVDMRDAYVLLHGPEAGTMRLADNVFGGGYFSYVENATLDAVTGRVRNIYGGTYGTTVDAAVAQKIKDDNAEKAKTQTSTWGSEFNADEYEVLSEMDLTQLKNADYTGETAVVNVYPQFTQNPLVYVYGAGAYTGVNSATVNLLGGDVNEVYGGSNQEGVCKDVVVNIPVDSEVKIDTLYGGSHGSYKALPCDVRNSIINFNSSKALVRSGLVFGGNNQYRASHNTVINYTAQAVDANGDYLQLFGAGNGEFSVAGNTHICVNSGSKVSNVYGGGYAGQVFNKYDVLKDAGEAPAKPEPVASDASAEQKAAYEANYKKYLNYHDASHYKRYLHDDPHHSVMSYAHWYETSSHFYDYETHDIDHQTHITLNTNVSVMGSVYGAGYGYSSTVSGRTRIDCNGATINGDIFGGGFAGNVRKMTSYDTGYQQYDVEFYTNVTEESIDVADTESNGTVKKDESGNIIYKTVAKADVMDNYLVTTTINMHGGQVRNIFGGGYAGTVGGEFVWDEDGDSLKCSPVTGRTYKFEAVTNVNVGLKAGENHLVADTSGKLPGTAGYTETESSSLDIYSGKPAINFSVYGAGDRGPVFGQANVTMNNGYVGYDYRTYTAVEAAELNAANAGKQGWTTVGTTTPAYIERIKASAADKKNLMKEDGNLYGGGFGEDARVLYTNVILNGGQIRNSLYGGGEMSAVGWGTVTENNKDLQLQAIQAPGSTFIEMYGGQVNADVFGGGRGYSYDNNGEKQYGRLYNTDGFVFGKTDVNIYRGTIGTDATLSEGHGNVFGGGNVGYVYSGNGTSRNETTDEITTHYYYDSSNKLTEDTRVNVQVYGMAENAMTDEGQKVPFTIVYHPGFTVPNIIKERFRANHGTVQSGGHTYRLADTLTVRTLIDAENRALNEFTYTDDGVFAAGEYIPNDALNTLANTATQWNDINQDGITIRNAVFAGGNVSAGSDKVYAFANTVFGNATASIIDVYARDLIDIGADGIGGLYGDGNLTFVHGYRELNITNYGTDYYALSGNIDFDNPAAVALYDQLTARQQQFYTTKYECTAAIESYHIGDVITNEDLTALAEIMKAKTDSPWPDDWFTAGTWQTYFKRTAAIINEGRFLNTIQRADYCGLKGSRLVMKGAMDRAIGENEDVDYTPYTINRLGELSLNQNNITIDSEFHQHGSYAGFYNVVKYLGSMSSDKNFVTGLSGSGAGTADVAQSSIRQTTSTNSDDTKNIDVDFEYTNKNGSTPSSVADLTPAVTKHLYDPKSEEGGHGVEGAYTFFEWKVANHDQTNRNNGTSPNKIALASGVFLELVREPAANSTSTAKNYGPIIGVVELDLLDVAPGEGGGFVYAENHHGLPTFDSEKSYASVISDANFHLKTCRAYSYADTEDAPEQFNGVETSGNFVHSSKRIVDDCFPISNSFKGAPGATAPYAEAHYWYLRGDFYVYDQLVSAFTGKADKYSSEINIPLDLNGKQNATIRLLNVLPGLYADPNAVTYDGANEKSDSLQIIFNTVTKSFGHNDPVSYWDWHNMNSADQAKFVLKTYTVNDTLSVVTTGTGESATTTYIPGVVADATVYYPGQAILPAVYNGIGTEVYLTNSAGEFVDADGNVVKSGKEVAVRSLINETNSVRTSEGFVLTLDMTNPNVWNDYYYKADDGTKLTTEEWNEFTKSMSSEQKAAFLKSATFRVKPDESGVYGKYTFNQGDIASKTVYDMEAEVESHLSDEQKAEIRSSLAKFERAYVTTDSCDVVMNGVTRTLLKGYKLSETELKSITSISYLDSDGKSYTVTKEVGVIGNLDLVKPAYVCVSTIEVAEKDYRFMNQVISETEYDSYSSGDKQYNGKTLKNFFQPAYICTGGEATDATGGSWGGKYYEAGKDYNGVDFCEVKPEERAHFTFNYDALDLLRTDYDPYNTNGSYPEADVLDAMRSAGTTLNEQVSGYDNPATVLTSPLYSIAQGLDITATFDASRGTGFTYVDSSLADGKKTIVDASTLTGKQYANLPNDRKYYAKIVLADSTIVDGVHKKYIVKQAFDVAGKMYNVGQTISATTYENLATGGNQTYIDVLTFKPDEGKVAEDLNDTYYYCIEDYKIGEKDDYVKDHEGESDVPHVSNPVTTIAHTSGDAEISDVTIAKGSVVPAGSVIKAVTLEGLPNYQYAFSLSGASPMEEATLYVPADASIMDLLKDRYVTAIYEYRYSETNDGISYETFVEKHIINIRLKFMDGQPKIGNLTPPELILPKENITMEIPVIEEGAFPIIGSGWEIYPTFEEAQRHVNGRSYSNGTEPLYWYQNGYYIAYYAETTRGRVYSQPEEIKVANYHKLADVVNDANHMFIDHKDCDRNPKIYIFDTPETSVTAVNSKKFINIKEQKGYTTAAGGDNNVNELDALKYLFELSTSAYAGVGGQIKESEDENAKIVIQNHGRSFQNCANLEFYLSGDVEQIDYKYVGKETVGDEETDVTKTDARPWTSIGTSDHCFSGTINGNGHTISGLEQSLFGYLCGSVYNLGVTGTFTGSGIADHGSGRAENCWIWTDPKNSDGTAATIAPNTKAVMGDDGAGENSATVVNCYYPTLNTYVAGTAKLRTPADFLNGQVAYDLNRFYLEGRHKLGSGEDGAVTDNVIYRLANGDIETYIDEESGIEYLKQYEIKYSNDDAGFTGAYKVPQLAADGKTIEYVDKKLAYVEHLYEDGDFRYADGLKPKTADIREVDDNTWVPIFPDDYIFFGQVLSYKLYDNRTHDQHPRPVVKNKTTEVNKVVNNDKNGYISYTNEATTNRLFRAPAYFRNGTYGRSVIFNAQAAFRNEIKVGDPKTGTDAEEYDEDVMPYENLVPKDTYRPHEGMTAIDFTGGNGDLTGEYGRPTEEKNYYAPLLDFDRLEGIRTNGITQNLLVYTPASSEEEGSAETHNNAVLSAYFVDPAFATYNVASSVTGTAATNSVQVYKNAANVKGHIVLVATEDAQGRPLTYKAEVDHFLVDKQDFNAPMEYEFAQDKHMWYQRTPKYAQDNKGWEGVSLPFQVERVATQDKGEITHFYDGSTTGHEYWLREYTGKVSKSAEEPTVYVANFTVPDDNGTQTKTDANKFLYNYYYSRDEFNDKNTDKYKDYYKSDRTYAKYPLQAAGSPYIAGFPGSMYYEFDLSGIWVPSYRVNDEKITNPGAQTISFVSPAGATINVSDGELTEGTKTAEGYTFVPTYLNADDVNMTTTSYYQLSADGASYELVSVGTEEAPNKFVSVPFRPYFKKVISSAKEVTRSIVIGENEVEIEENPENRRGLDETNSMKIYVRGHKLVIESTYDATLNVYYINGQFVRKVDVKEGTNTYDGFRPGFYIVGNKKVNFAPGNY